MTIEEQINYWFDSANDDIKVADNLLEGGYLTWCLFIGHLILEKSLKGYWVYKLNSTPPNIHDLITIAERTDLALEDDLKRFFFIMNKFQLETRYPAYKAESSKIATKEFAAESMLKIKDTYLWLKTLII